MDVKFISSPNFSSRRDQKVSAIVLRATESMAMESTIRLMESEKTRISGHFLIPRSQEEQVIQMVDVQRKAWHAGRAILWGDRNVSLFSVSVQLVAVKNSGYTDWQYEKAAEICCNLMDTFPGITLNRIVGQEAISETEKTKGELGPMWSWELFFDILVRKLYDLSITRT